MELDLNRRESETNDKVGQLEGISYVLGNGLLVGICARFLIFGLVVYLHSHQNMRTATEHGDIYQCTYTIAQIIIYTYNIVYLDDAQMC